MCRCVRCWREFCNCVLRSGCLRPVTKGAGDGGAASRACAGRWRVNPRRFLVYKVEVGEIPRAECAVLWRLAVCAVGDRKPVSSLRWASAAVGVRAVRPHPDETALTVPSWNTDQGVGQARESSGCSKLRGAVNAKTCEYISTPWWDRACPTRSQRGRLVHHRPISPF